MPDLHSTAEEASAAARDASGEASAATKSIKGSGGFAATRAEGLSKPHEKAAGLAHIVAAKSHRLAAKKPADPQAAERHEQNANAHDKAAEQHAKNAGDAWDHKAYPFDRADAAPPPPPAPPPAEVRTDAAPAIELGVERLDLSSGSVTGQRQTPQGGLIVDANLTRTGIFPYRMPDGSVRRELRSPDEVMSPASLASYAMAPVTVDHPGRVGPSNWKTHAVGHAGSVVRPNGDFVTGELHLQHDDAIERAKSKELQEVSCGYTCDVDPTPGQYKGQPFDATQRNIRMNHIAIGPAGWGRMGKETRMHLDSAQAVSGEMQYDEAPSQSERDKMHESQFADPENKKYPIDTVEHTKAAASYAAQQHNAGKLSDAKFGDMMARINRARKKFGIGEENQPSGKSDGAPEGPGYLRAVTGDSHHPAGATMALTAEEQAAQDKAKADQLQADLDKSREDAKTAREDAKNAKSDSDKLEAEGREKDAKLATVVAENELLKLQIERSRNDGKSAEEQRKAEREQQERVEEIVSLRADARIVFANTDDPEGKNWKADGKNADAIRREILMHLEPTVKLDSLDSKGLGHVYQIAIGHEKRAAKARADAEALARAPRNREDGGVEGDGDGDGEDDMDAAKERKAMVKRKKDGWKMGRKDRRAAAAGMAK